MFSVSSYASCVKQTSELLYYSVFNHPVAEYAVSKGMRVEVYRAASNDLAKLPPDVVKGLEVANQRFIEERPELSPTHVFDKQKQVKPEMTSYFVLKGMAGKVEGLGLLLDGRRGRCAIEEEFPEVDFRSGGKDIWELARLGLDKKIKGGLTQVYSAMAQHLLKVYGGISGVPSNAEVVLWTSSEKLATSVYHERDEFAFVSGTSLRTPPRWALRKPLTEFIRSHLGQSGINSP